MSAFLGVRAPRELSTAGVSGSPVAGSQWRDRAGIAPGFLHCRRLSQRLYAPQPRAAAPAAAATCMITSDAPRVSDVIMLMIS